MLSDNNNEEFVKEMIGLMKSNLMQRNYPLTLIFRKALSIQSVMKINKILENDNSFNSKLKIEF